VLYELHSYMVTLLQTHAQVKTHCISLKIGMFDRSVAAPDMLSFSSGGTKSAKVTPADSSSSSSRHLYPRALRGCLLRMSDNSLLKWG
jgi:hypothetical protein